VVVELGVLELLEVERGGVLHEAHAHPVAEHLSEQPLQERRRAAEQVAAEHDRDLEGDELPEAARVGGGEPLLRGGDHRVDDELPHPQREHGERRADRAQTTTADA
jgi:hypothetical protein